MSCVENSQRIVNYLFLSLLYCDSVFSATIETAQTLEDGNEGIYKEDNGAEDTDILHIDFLDFSTRKQYFWDDWTDPTEDPIDYEESSSSTNFILYVMVPIFAIITVAALLYYCCKQFNGDGCCSDESDSDSSESADRFTIVHRPPRGRNQQATSRRERGMRNLFNELRGNPGANISFVNSTYASSTLGKREPDNAISENPPDYSTVTLNDLISPTKPAFPVVKTKDETPPPEYGKGNRFL